MDNLIFKSIGYLALVGMTVIIYWLGKGHQDKTMFQIILFVIWAILGGGIMHVMGLGNEF